MPEINLTVHLEYDEVVERLKSEGWVIPVRCKDCINYVESEEANGEKMCVRDADWCVEDGSYYGFTEYPSPDWFCADGERKGEDKEV